jgi:membrane-associated phospholipid phosphatase
VPRRSTIPLLVALACGLVLALTGLLALASPGAHERDAAMLHGFVALDRPGVHGLMVLLARLADPVPYALGGLALVVAALAQRRRARAGAVAALLVLTGATTQVLKHVLAQPRFEAWLGADQIGDAAWPSGHATAAMTLALCAVLVAPPALRALAALAGGALAAGVGYSVIVLAWHFPSDVVGGFLVAGAWAALAVAALRVVEARPAAECQARPAPSLARVGVTAAAAALVMALLAVPRDTLAFYASERPTLVAGALVIAAVAGALSAGLARAA